MSGSESLFSLRLRHFEVSGGSLVLVRRWQATWDVCAVSPADQVDDGYRHDEEEEDEECRL